MLFLVLPYFQMYALTPWNLKYEHLLMKIILMFIIYPTPGQGFLQLNLNFLYFKSSHSRQDTLKGNILVRIQVVPIF